MPKRVVPEGSGRRVPVMTRVTNEMRERLESAAADSGRSLGQEVEYRLEQSFSGITARDEGTALLLRAIGDTVLLVERRCGPWTESDPVALLCRKAILGVIDTVLPKDGPIGARAAHEAETIGKITALKEILALAETHASSSRENKLLNAMRPRKAKSS